MNLATIELVEYGISSAFWAFCIWVIVGAVVGILSALIISNN